MALSSCISTRLTHKNIRSKQQVRSRTQPVRIGNLSQQHADQSCVRLRALPTAEVADLDVVVEGLGVLGIAAGGLFGALWNLEKQNGAKLQQELQDLQQQVKDVQKQLGGVQQQLAKEQQARKEAESWKPRLDSAQEELFKLEKALEIKDGQLAVFMNTAHRQIKGLEDTVKELQKM